MTEVNNEYCATNQVVKITATHATINKNNNYMGQADNDNNF